MPSGDAIHSQHIIGRASLGDDSDANKLFLMYLFSDKDFGTQCLKDFGLLHSKVTCNTRSCDMYWYAEPKFKDGFRWRCRRSAYIWSTSTPVRYGSWFQHSNLTFHEVMFLTYDIVRRVPAQLIQRGASLHSQYDCFHVHLVGVQGRLL